MISEDVSVVERLELTTAMSCFHPLSVTTYLDIVGFSFWDRSHLCDHAFYGPTRRHPPRTTLERLVQHRGAQRCEVIGLHLMRTSVILVDKSRTSLSAELIWEKEVTLGCQQMAVWPMGS